LYIKMYVWIYENYNSHKIYVSTWPFTLSRFSQTSSRIFADISNQSIFFLILFSLDDVGFKDQLTSLALVVNIYKHRYLRGVKWKSIIHFLRAWRLDKFSHWHNLRQTQLILCVIYSWFSSNFLINLII